MTMFCHNFWILILWWEQDQEHSMDVRAFCIISPPPALFCITFPHFSLPSLKEEFCFVWKKCNSWFYSAERMETEASLTEKERLWQHIRATNLKWGIINSSFVKHSVFLGIWYTGSFSLIYLWSLNYMENCVVNEFGVRKKNYGQGEKHF